MTDDLPLHTTDAFGELGGIRFSETTFDDVLVRIVDLARRTIPGATDVSVTLIGVGGAHTAVHTGERALVLDEWQYEYGHGPCLAAAATTGTVLMNDLAGTSRWPDWARHAVDVGAHSMVSVGVPTYESVVGAFNVYAREPDAFDDEAVVRALIFAGYAAMAMANSPRYAGQAGLERHMREAMDSRTNIERAKGVIIADRRCTPVEASAVLAKMARYSGHRIADVAAALVSGAVDARSNIIVNL